MFLFVVKMARLWRITNIMKSYILKFWRKKNNVNVLSCIEKGLKSSIFSLFAEPRKWIYGTEVYGLYSPTFMLRCWGVVVTAPHCILVTHHIRIYLQSYKMIKAMVYSMSRDMTEPEWSLYTWKTVGSIPDTFITIIAL